jgi:small subunit ribosomal protein S9
MSTEEKTKKVTKVKTVKPEKKVAVKKPVKKAEKVEKKIEKAIEVKTAEVKPEVKVANSETKKTEKKPVVPPKEQPKKKIVMYTAVGRRKTATAFAKLIVDPQNKEKKFTVNGKLVEVYFPMPQQKKAYLEPLRTTNTINRFDVTVKVSGSGSTGQLGAVIHAVSRALIKVDPERFSLILRKRGFLTRDPRAKERKKVGIMGARHVKQSPRR